MVITAILAILFALTTAVAAIEFPDLPTNLGCGVHFPLNNYTRHMIATNRNVTDEFTTNSADILGWEAYGGPNKWPRNFAKDGGYHSIIPYCYLDDLTRRILNPNVFSATQAWVKAMGGDVSQQTGHGVAFWEIFDDNSMEPLYCHTPGTKDWNTMLPYGTVSITVNENMGASVQATIGKQEYGRVAYMNFMQLGPRASVATITHEFGHIMGMNYCRVSRRLHLTLKTGMAHEHQRGDRDDHVKYNCEMVPHFVVALYAAKNMYGPNFSKDMLCDNT
jgi:hypothetical protein